MVDIVATDFRTTEEIEARLGEQFRAQRLADDIDQISLAKRANVSLSALKALEAGKGSSLRTVVRVARALDRLDWIEDFYPEPEVSPMDVVRAEKRARRPQRASNRVARSAITGRFSTPGISGPRGGR